MQDATVGTVISTPIDPTTSRFSFVINSSKVKKGQFVQTMTEEGIMLGVISEIFRANRYFEQPESVAEYEKISSMSLQFPTFAWEYNVASVKSLGIFCEGKVMRNAFPPAPGSKVEMVDEEILKKFLGFRDDGLNLGKLQNHDLDVKIGMGRLLQKHLSILAMSGAGKSYLCSVLIEEMLERKMELGRIGIVVIDPHGEYSVFKNTEYRNQVQVFEGKKIKISLKKVSPQQLFEWMPNLSPAQKREAATILKCIQREMRDKGESFGLEDLVKKIETSELRDNVRNALLSWFWELATLKVIGRADLPNIRELAKPGILSIIDLSDIDSLRRKQVIVSYFGKKLFAQRKKNAIPPFVLIVEEAHNFAPEKVQKEAAISKNVIETFAREGRKFGACICLVSQRPVRLSTTALSQCNTNIILKITNPFDLKHVAESCEGIDANTQSAITTLGVGEALIIGEAVNYPVFIKVRKKRAETKTQEELESLAVMFEKEEEKKGKDVDAFI
ncbi:MAG: ATP-binding protein [Candidatus Anstonellales archaeon]